MARLGPSRPAVPPYWRPTTRADCSAFARPCPFVGCRYNLVIDISATGGIVYRAPANWTDLPGSNCALDHAAVRSQTREDIGLLMGTTKERIRQEEGVALRKLVGCGIERPEAFGIVPQEAYDLGPDDRLA